MEWTLPRTAIEGRIRTGDARHTECRAPRQQIDAGWIADNLVCTGIRRCPAVFPLGRDGAEAATAQIQTGTGAFALLDRAAEGIYSTVGDADNSIAARKPSREVHVSPASLFHAILTHHRTDFD
jgi:hypothetical protein